MSIALEDIPESEVYVKLIHKCKHDRTEVTLNTRMLSAEQRSVLHQYCTSLKLSTYSEKVSSGDGKLIVVTPIEKPIDQYKSIKLFVKNTKVPIANIDPDNIDYYIDALDPYYNCKELWSTYQREMRDTGRDPLLNLQNISNAACKAITSHPEIAELKRKIEDKELVFRTDKNTKETTYRGHNAGKHFVSFDMIKANFSSLKLYCPTLFPGSWVDFIGQFTDSETVKMIKLNRETIIGLSKLSKTVRKIMEHIVHDLYLFMREQIPELGDRVYKCCDELIFETNVKLSGHSLAEFREKINHTLSKFPKAYLFRTEYFHLKQMQDTKYYYKLHHNGTILPRGVPKNYMMHFIKKLEGKDVNELDLTALDGEGVPYVYKKSVFD